MRERIENAIKHAEDCRVDAAGTPEWEYYRGKVCGLMTALAIVMKEELCEK